jgi:hypothetical protein
MGRACTRAGSTATSVRGLGRPMATWQARADKTAGRVTAGLSGRSFWANSTRILGTLGMETVSDEAAGHPDRAAVGVLGAPGRARAPFVCRYDGAARACRRRWCLISQPGDQSRGSGPYEIMQTLEIVPEEGPRERTQDAFVIEGQDGAVHSTTYAWLVDGQIKGFSLVWPAGDDDRRGAPRRGHAGELPAAAERARPGRGRAGRGPGGGPRVGAAGAPAAGHGLRLLRGRARDGG